MVSYVKRREDWKDEPDLSTPVLSTHLEYWEEFFYQVALALTTVESGKVDKSTATAKGSIFIATASGVITQLPVGANPNGHVLTLDSTTPEGAKWAAPTGGGSAPDATTTSKGIIQLTNHLGGTAAAPTVPALANKADLNSGRVPTNQLGTGTANNTTVLHGDQVWRASSGGGISPTLVNQRGALIVGDEFGVPAKLWPPDLGAFDGEIPVYDSTQPLGWTFQPYPTSSAKTLAVRAINMGPGFLVKSGPQTVDGVACVVGNRVIEGNTVNADGGIWEIQTGGWTRPTEFSGAVPNGTIVTALEGTRNGGKTFSITRTDNVNADITVNTHGVTVTPTPGPSIFGAYETLTTVPGTNIFHVLRQGAYICNITADGSTISIQEGDGNNASVINVCIKMDSVGNKRFEFAPSTIVWDSGTEAPLSTGDPLPYSLSANTTTFVRFTWMGPDLGYFGEIVNVIPPLYTLAPSQWTNTQGVGWGGIVTQNFNFDIYIMRYVPTDRRNWALDALIQFFSAALRQRLANNGFDFELCARWPTDGIRGAKWRGTGTNNVAGFLDQDSQGYYGTSVTMFGQTETVKAVCHETCHGISYAYYNGANSADPHGLSAIENHPTLVTLHNDCLTDGGPAGRSEWFAELERNRRLLIMGVTVDQPSLDANTGLGTSTGTPASRVTRFNNYMSTLNLV